MHKALPMKTKERSALLGIDFICTRSFDIHNKIKHFNFKWHICNIEFSKKFAT